jgi:hypothetical protein
MPYNHFPIATKGKIYTWAAVSTAIAFTGLRLLLCPLNPIFNFERIQPFLEFAVCRIVGANREHPNGIAFYKINQSDIVRNGLAIAVIAAP